MPIAFDIEQLRKEHNCSIYFETGLWDPREDISSKAALLCGFDKVYCIEIREDWVELGKKIFEKDIEKGRYNLILDDSTNMKQYVNSHVFSNKTMFFLDAHVDNSNIHNYKKRCPLFEELKAIKSINRNDNVILIDDLRLLRNSFPWGEESYGDIDFIQQIKDIILSINENYKFSLLDGYVKDDVLLAYVSDTTYQKEQNTFIVTGGAGFIGSHLTDSLIQQGHRVIVLDNLLSGFEKNINKDALFYNCDIRKLDSIKEYFKNVDGVFHLAAIARTPWCVEDPILAYETNVIGTLNVLEASRLNNIKRVVMTSSNVIYAAWTPYRSSKEALESLAKVYNTMYGLSVVCLRNSNVYGSRQSELGPSPNVFSALRKSKRDNGFIEISGDGTQSRDFTHVSDIVKGHICAMNTDVIGEFDLCTGINHSLNDVAKYFNCDVKYISERSGDIKHIVQDARPALDNLKWKAEIALEDGMKDFFSDTTYQKEQTTFILTVCYRARGSQSFRKDELIKLIRSCKDFFEKGNVSYKIVVTEQNDDNLFNRGILLNISFLESEKLFKFPKMYFHTNTDYYFNLNYLFPKEFMEFKSGFLDCRRILMWDVLGAACLFDSESYKKINGFPNDLVGWGGDDWAIFHRIKQNNINYKIYEEFNITNNGIIIEKNPTIEREDCHCNEHNMKLASRNDWDTNGLTSCKYTVEGTGEFHDGNTVYHFVVNINV